MCLIFLLNDLACFSFRSAAAAEPVQQSLQKNLNPHRGSGQADIDEGQIESGIKNGGYFFAQRVQSFCREPAMKWVTGAARARFLAAFARSKAVPPEAGASMTCAPHLRDDGPAKRRGRENGQQYAGPLLGGFHAGHLRPCDHRRPTQGSTNHGEHPLPCRLMLSATRSRWGQRLGQKKATSENDNL